MTDPVDLTNLHEITDNNTELETMLFDEFFISCVTSLEGLKASLDDSAAAAWKSHAHALKGVALNLGAMQLGALGMQAQEGAASTIDTKKQLLDAIQQEYAMVEAFLRRTQAA